MKTRSNSLWPYGTALAIAAILVVWLLGVAIALTHTYLRWPNAEFGRLIVYIALVASLILLLLLLLDLVALRRAVLDIKGVKIDFSRVEAREESVRLPENIGEPAAIVTDSSLMKIVSALERRSAVHHLRCNIIPTRSVGRCSLR